MIAVIIVSVLLAIAHSKKGSDELGLCSLAIAQFDGSQGVTGFVNIDQNGKVLIRLDTSNLDTSLCADSGSGGFTYHVHNEWNHPNMTNRFADDCGASYTAGHYNPYGVPVCSTVDEIDYFNCEVGDLSGRFGVAVPDNDKISIDGYVVARKKCGNTCEGRLNPESVSGKSVVFHCQDGQRLFCAAFEPVISS